MADEPARPDEVPPPPVSPEEDEDRDRPPGISDFVRRAVLAGLGAATRSKDDVMRIAAGEVRTWLDRMDLDEEIVKALSRMVVEVKTEIRFRTNDEGKLVPEATHDTKVKGAPKL